MTTCKHLHIWNVCVSIFVVMVTLATLSGQVHAKSLNDPTIPVTSPTELPFLVAAEAATQNRYFEQIGQMGDHVDITAVAADESDRVYYADGTTFKVAAMVTSNRLEQLGFLSGLPGKIVDIKVIGNHAFLVVEKIGIWVIDVSKPVLPEYVSSLQLNDAKRIAVFGDFGYVISGSSLLTIDISDSTNLRYISETYPGANGRSLVISGDYAYISSYDGFAIVDISHPASPQVIGRFKFPYANESSDDLVITGETAYVISSFGEIYVFDISNKAQPKELGKLEVTRRPDVADQYLVVFDSYLYLIAYELFSVYETTTSALPPLIYTQGVSYGFAKNINEVAVGSKFMFFAVGSYGLRVFDVHTPSVPTQVRSDLSEDLIELGGISNLDNWLYAVNGGVLEVYDITSPESPSLASRVAIAGYASTVWRAEDRLYLLVAPNSRLVIYDLSIPNQPTPIGEVAIPFNMEELTIHRNAIYGLRWIADSRTYRLLTFDTTDASSPIQLDPIELAWGVSNLFADSSYLFVSGTQLIDDNWREVLVLYDIAKQTLPEELGRYRSLISKYGIGGVATVGSFAYLSYSDHRVEIVDISEPLTPTYVGEYEGSFNRMVFSDTHVAVMKTVQGLDVLEIDSPTKPMVIDSLTLPYGTIAVYYPNIIHASLAGVSIFRYLSPERFSVPTLGAVWTVSDGTEYSFPSGTFTESLSVEHITHYAPPLDLPTDLTYLGHSFEFHAHSPITETLAPFTISVPIDGISTGFDKNAMVGLYASTITGWAREATGIVDQQKGLVIFTTNRFGRWSLLAERSPISHTNQLYIPLTFRSDLDVRIRNIEVTQAVQNPENSVPLVEKRPTLLRVFAEVLGNEAVDGITLSLSGTRDGSPLPGSPIQIGPLSVFQKPLRSNLGDSFNILLPPDWLYGDVAINLTVDSTNQLNELDETNNTMNANLVFHPVPALDVVIIPIRWTNKKNSLTCLSQGEDYFSDWLMRAFPLNAVNVQFHIPFDVTTEETESDPLYKMWEAVAGLKQSEGKPYGVVYFGTVSEFTGSGDRSSCATSGGYLGLGGVRVGVGYDYNYSVGPSRTTTAAHEIGHGLGRIHTFEDPNYPYPNDSIGQYGVDIGRMQLWLPILPDQTYDIMNSTDGWVSDYTYTGLYEDQVRYGISGAADSTAKILMLRVNFEDEAQATIEPLYVLTGTLSALDESSGYTAELFDQQRDLVAAYPLELTVAHGKDKDFVSIHANIPFTVTGLSLIRVKHHDQVIAERRLVTGPSSFDLKIHYDAQDAVLTWDQPEAPGLVQYSKDDGVTWTTVGIDVYGGFFQVNLANLPGGDLMFRVTMGDLISPLSSIAVLYKTLPNTAPKVWITGPTMLKTDQPLLLFGHSADREDGVIDHLTWVIDGQEISADQILQRSSISPGQHTVTVIVQDADGLRSTATHLITVENGSMFESHRE